MMGAFCNLCDAGLIPAHVNKVNELRASADVLRSLTSRVPYINNEASLSDDDIELVGDLITTAYFGMLEKYDEIIENTDMTSVTPKGSAWIQDIAERREEIVKCL